MLGEVDADRGRAAGRVRTRSSSGPTRSARASSAVRANADNGPDAANARQFGAEGIGLCRTEHMFLGEDRLPVVRRMILADARAEESRRARGAARRAEGRLRGDPRGDGRPARSPCACSTRRCTSSCRASTSSRSRRRPTGLDRGGAALLDGGARLARVQPDARHPRRAPRRREAGPLRHAGAGADGGGGRARRRRAASRSSRS